VSGAGLAILRDAGIEVETGIGESAAIDLLAGYLARHRLGRPSVTLKLATSLDGRIATHTGASRWITGAPARARGHLLRARHDAILVGAATARSDDPDLTCRLPGLAGQSPVRVVLDGDLTLSVDSRLARTARERATWVICQPGAVADRIEALDAQGVQVIPVAADAQRRPSPDAAFAALGARGINSVLVEGGAGVARSLLLADLVDTITLFRAPVVIGGDGRAAVDGLAIADLASAPRFERVRVETLGPDTLETLRRQA
jgi:diaminohydroxyphosphoribosylaminopyrimidine deaminase/5-amino-6-(5-phosphoribosylamino)uracil reductase